MLTTKMSTATLVAVLFTLLTCTHSLKKVDIAFVLDGSKSIVESEFNDGKQWIVRTVRDMRRRFASLTRFAVLQYSAEESFEIPIGLNDCFRESEDIGEAIENMTQIKESSFLAAGLLRVVETTFPNSDLYMSALRFVFILTDGRFSDSEDLQKWRTEAEKLNVIIFGLGLSNYNLTELRVITGSHDVAGFEEADKRDRYLSLVEEYILESGAADAISKLDRDCRIKACEMGSRLDDYPDSSYEASSTLTDVQPSDARLFGTNAWTPAESEFREYIQLDFGITRPVGGVIIEGQLLGTSHQYVESFKIACGTSYGEYVILGDENGDDRVFTGNTNTTSEVVVTLDNPIYCQIIRILPESWNNKITMRFAVLRGDCISYF